MITTERLILRPHRIEDLDALCALDTDAEARRYNGGVADREKTERYLRRHIAEFGNGRSWKFAIELTGRSETSMIGWCWLKYEEALDGYEIGYQVAREHWGQGIATEAARGVMDFASRNSGSNGSPSSSSGQISPPFESPRNSARRSGRKCKTHVQVETLSSTG
jgi:RimJ/RimL family protein N-acetyltransferase